MRITRDASVAARVARSCGRAGRMRLPSLGWARCTRRVTDDVGLRMRAHQRTSPYQVEPAFVDRGLIWKWTGTVGSKPG